ncbi:MAG: hypothetical protein RMK65_13040, partial [Anaerolineae bacterium]|nr:hypothetical protein [Anaerolineae bacterium]
MKRYLLTLMALVTTLTLVVACAPQTVTVTVERTVPVRETVQVTVEKPVAKRVVIYNSYMSDPAPREADAALVRMFEEEHPD